jgi:hypothetical protein
VRALLSAAAASALVVSCGQPAAPTSTAPTSTASVPAAPPVTASVPVPASVPLPASAAVAPAVNDPVVMELRRAMPEKTVSLAASGRVVRVTGWPFGEDDREEGHVTPASIEALHQALKAARFCDLAPKLQESAAAYTVIDARFPDVACLVELPDPRWEKAPVPRKVIDAVRRIEADAFSRR